MYTTQDIKGDDVSVVPNLTDGTVELEETIDEDGVAGDTYFTSLSPSAARKLAMQLLQAANEVDPL